MNADSITKLFGGEDGEQLAREYLEEQGLLAELTLGSNNNNRIAPKWMDLARLHASIRGCMAITVLEFGVGFSTLTMADGLSKNKQDWERIVEKPEIRNSNMFELHSVDTSEKWIDKANSLIPGRLKDIVTLHHSPVYVGTFQDRMCHFYKQIPDIVPDFIYLDGPDPANVEGALDGLSWHCEDRVVMAGDILRLEPILLPGTLIIVDGRKANARFIGAHLYRSWNILDDEKGDVTVFDLQEASLGEYNRAAMALKQILN